MQNLLPVPYQNIVSDLPNIASVDCYPNIYTVNAQILNVLLYFFYNYIYFSLQIQYCCEGLDKTPSSLVICKFKTFAASILLQKFRVQSLFTLHTVDYCIVDAIIIFDDATIVLCDVIIFDDATEWEMRKGVPQYRWHWKERFLSFILRPSLLLPWKRFHGRYSSGLVQLAMSQVYPISK